MVLSTVRWKSRSMEACRALGHPSTPIVPRKSRAFPACSYIASSVPNSKRMFVFGIGFVAKFFSQQLKNEGWVVSGTCRSGDKRKELEQMGFEAFVYDSFSGDVECLTRLEDASHMLVSIPPVTGFGDPLLYLHKEVLRSKLDNGNLKWLCYLSSTSVYGDAGGAWVDEDYPAAPVSESSMSRLIAEKGWLDLGHDLGISTFVFRLGGIYGPRRSALDTILKGKSQSGRQKRRESKSYTSRVHVFDICQALKNSINKPLSSGGIYNIVDDEPAPRSEVFAFARKLINQRWPGRVENQPMCPVTSSATEDEDITLVEDRVGGTGEEKRVLNTRMKKELGVNLIHPTYRSGLSSIVDSL